MSDANSDTIDWQKILDSQFADERAFAGRLSDVAKFVWAGTLALFYGAMFADKGALADFFHAGGLWLWLAAICGGAALAFDLVKNWAGLTLSRDAQVWLIAHWKQKGGSDFVKAYNANLRAAKRLFLPLRLLNRTMFALSILASLAAAALVAVAVVGAFFVSDRSSGGAAAAPQPPAADGAARAAASSPASALAISARVSSTP